MADNFNINTTQEQSLESGGLEKDNPSMTYVDFANQMARNALAQKQQEALVQQAQANARTATLGATQKEQAAGLGVNPEMKDFFTVDEAVAYLRAAGVNDDAIKAFTDSLGDKQVVSRAAVDTIIRKKELGAKTGQPFIATKADVNSGKTDENGDPLVAGQSYMAFHNSSTGETEYVRGGGEALSAQEGRLGIKESEADEKQWQKLGTLIQSAMKSRSGPVGMLGTTIIRSLRALNTLNHGKLTKQDVANVSSDIAAIYQGGVPSIVQVSENNYGTKLQDLAETLRRYTGILSYFGNDKVMADTMAKLKQVLEDMRNSAVEQMQKFVEMQFPFFEDIINKDPDRWERVQTKVLDFITAGEVSPTGGVIAPSGAPKKEGEAAPAAKEETGGPDIHAIATALGLKKKAQ